MKEVRVLQCSAGGGDCGGEEGAAAVRLGHLGAGLGGEPRQALPGEPRQALPGEPQEAVGGRKPQSWECLP